MTLPTLPAGRSDNECPWLTLPGRGCCTHPPDDWIADPVGDGNSCCGLWFFEFSVWWGLSIRVHIPLGPKWADWKERVRDGPRPFILTYLTGVAGGVIVIVLDGLMTPSPFGKYSSSRSPVWGDTVLAVGV